MKDNVTAIADTESHADESCGEVAVSVQVAAKKLPASRYVPTMAIPGQSFDCYHCRKTFRTAQKLGLHARWCSKKNLPEERPREELEAVAEEYGITVGEALYTGQRGRRYGRLVALVRGVFFHRMWTMNVPPYLVAKAIGCDIRSVRHWYAGCRKAALRKAGK